MVDIFDVYENCIESTCRTKNSNERILSINFNFYYIRFVQNISKIRSQQSSTSISIENFFSLLEKERDIFFVSVTLGEDVIWSEDIILNRLSNIEINLIFEIGSSASTKIYIKCIDKEKIKIIDLNSKEVEITRDDLLTKLKSKDSFGIPLIIEALKQGLIGHFNDSPYNHRSLTDVTFMINEISREEESDLISLDYSFFHNDDLSSCWLSLHIYNILYNVISSNDVYFFYKLMDKCKVNYIMESFKNILPKFYEDIRLKDIFLTKEMKFVIEDNIINFSFFIDETEDNKKEVIFSVDDLHKRIDIISNDIDNLETKYVGREDIDGAFIYIATGIARSIHILKHKLNRTYDRLPWEEMEFCLISFISSQIEHKEISYVCKIILNTKKIITYLKKFKVDLNKLKDQSLDLNQINETKLETNLEIYKDYSIIKNIYSLKRIEHYITLALEMDLDKEEELGKLLIERVLQVTGESLKNTPESPNLSDDVHCMLLDLEPRNIKQIVTSLRDSLSHFNTLKRKMEFEDVKKFDFFKNELRNDLKKIKNVINYIFDEKIMEILKIIFNKIIESNDLLEVKKLLSIVNKVDFGKNKINDSVIEELEQIKKLIDELHTKIENITEEEKALFCKIDEIIALQKVNVKKVEAIYLDEFSKLNQLENINDLIYIQNSCRQFLKEQKTLVPSDKLRKIMMFVMDIFKSVTLRTQNNKEIWFVTSKILHITAFDAGQIQGINAFKNSLLKKEEDIERKTAEKISDVLDEIINILHKTSDKESIIFREAYEEKQKLYQDYKVRKENLQKVKGEMIPLFEKLVKKEINQSDTEVQSTFIKIDKLVNNKELRRLFKEGKWEECKKKVEKLEISRDNYQNLFNSVKNNIINEKCDMSLCFRDFVSSFKIKNNITKSVHKIIDSIFMEEIKVFFDTRLKILKRLLSFFNNQEKLQIYKENQKLQSAVEMLILDLSEVLQNHGRFGDNQLSLERYCPILIGKTLRNYLAHGNALIDILPCDPSIAILCNALKFIKEGNDLFLKDTRLIGQKLVGNLTDLAYRYNQGLDLVNNQYDMFTAAKEGNIEIIKSCINKGADIKGRDYKGWSTLHFAAQGNNMEILEFFLDENVSPDILDIDCQTPFHIAATFGSNDIIKILLEKGTYVNRTSKNNWTPLHLSAKNGHIDVVRTLLYNKANVNDKTIENLSALDLAKRNGHKNVVKYLLENGGSSDINNRYKYDFLSLFQAALQCNISDVENIFKNVKEDEKVALLETKDKDGRPPLYWAVFNDRNDVVNFLLKEGADVNAKCIDGSTLLHTASAYGHAAVVETLLRNGAKIDCPNEDLYTALDFASEFGHEKVVDILLKNNASVVAQNKCGDTPLHCAARRGRDKVVETLLNGHIEVNVTNKRNKTALHVAATFGHAKVIERLLSKCPNINAIDENGWTPLHCAAVKGVKDIVDQLLMKGAVFDFKTPEGLTALDFAIVNDHKDIVKRLMDEKIKNDGLRSKRDSSLSSHDIFKKSFIAAIIMNEEEQVKSYLNLFGKDDILDENGWRPIHWAVSCNQANIVKLLLDKNANCNITDNKDVTPLHCAAGHGCIEMVEILLTKVINIDPRDKDKMTPLHYATLNDHKKVVELLLRDGADINSEDFIYRTPLHHASYKNNVSMVDILLAKEAYLEAQDNNGRTPLHYAAMYGYEEVIERLINKGAVVNSRDKYGMAPVDYQNNYEKINFSCKKSVKINLQDKYNAAKELIKVFYILFGKETDFYVQEKNNNISLHYAARNNCTDIAEGLLINTPDVNPRDKYNWTPLHYGVFFGHKHMIELLLEKGADVNSKDNNNRTPLHYAAFKCDKYIAECLLENGAEVNVQDNSKMTPLHFASQINVSGNNIFIQMLLDAGAIVDVQDNIKRTPLHYSARYGYVDIVKTLLMKVIDIDPRDVKNRTPLYYATKYGDLRIVELLLEKGADIDTEDIHKVTPLHKAVGRCDIPMIQYLLNKGAKVNARNDINMTPLHIGVFLGDESVVELLLKKGADIYARDVDNMTPLDYVELLGNSSMRQCLLTK